MNLAIKSTQTLQSLPQKSEAPKQPSLTQQVKDTTTMAQDSVSIKSGALPTLKGAAAGALGAGGGSVALLAATNSFKGYNAIIGVPAAIVAVAGGTVGGAVAANFSDSKLGGAGYGLAGGAAAGAATFAFIARNGGEIGSAALMGAIVGGVTGAAGGFFGSMVAEKQ